MGACNGRDSVRGGRWGEPRGVSTVKSGDCCVSGDVAFAARSLEVLDSACSDSMLASAGFLVSGVCWGSIIVPDVHTGITEARGRRERTVKTVIPKGVEI
jgi:hypothetical protein